MMFIPAFTANAMTSNFLSSISHLLSCDVPVLPSCGVYNSQMVLSARCCTSVLDFNSKRIQITSKLLTQC